MAVLKFKCVPAIRYNLFASPCYIEGCRKQKGFSLLSGLKTMETARNEGCRAQMPNQYLRPTKASRKECVIWLVKYLRQPQVVLCHLVAELSSCLRFLLYQLKYK